MKSMFEPGVSNEILQRMEKLDPAAKAQWGKMTVAQMLAHCQCPIQAGIGEKQLKQSFLGMLFGGMAKRQLLKDTPFKKNLPTDPTFVVKDDRHFETEKKLLQQAIQRFCETNKTTLVQKKHPFFGHLTADEWGLLIWKHMDHHLQQFGV